MALRNLVQVEEAFGACLAAILEYARPRRGSAASDGSVEEAEADGDACSDDSEGGGVWGDWDCIAFFDDRQQGDGRHEAAVACAGGGMPCGHFVDRGVASSEPSYQRGDDEDDYATSKPPPLPTAGDADDTRMAALFRRARRRLERLRRYNGAARFREARDLAAAVVGGAAGGGCRGLAAAAARLLDGSGYMPAAAVDEVEQQLDVAEAIWASGRCVV